MRTTVKRLFAVLWAVASAFSVYLAYSAFQIERDPRLIWAWLVASGLIFLSATWLTATVFFSRPDKDRSGK